MDSHSRNVRMEIKNEDFLPVEFQNVIVENSDSIIISLIFFSTCVRSMRESLGETNPAGFLYNSPAALATLITRPLDLRSSGRKAFVTRMVPIKLTSMTSSIF
ncbi:hypothetical protein AVEN_127038-1 [Araneus ventricosus]|uniref:Uncharacterized protein n=1 Tax=Araneus ventricosus TaxID=182803 RepID=A0A4Y2VS57_ARAVE|nr:hypothetical protein AVEN_127038-1 [Araneus ventricosus]